MGLIEGFVNSGEGEMFPPLNNVDVDISAPFGLPHIWLVQLIFSAGRVFFSHNNSARTVFFSQFQPNFSKPNGAKDVVTNNISLDYYHYCFDSAVGVI